LVKCFFEADRVAAFGNPVVEVDPLVSDDARGGPVGDGHLCGCRDIVSLYDSYRAFIHDLAVPLFIEDEKKRAAFKLEKPPA